MNGLEKDFYPSQIGFRQRKGLGITFMIIKEKIMRFPGLCRERSQTLFLVSISLIIIFALSLEWPTHISQSSKLLSI